MRGVWIPSTDCKVLTSKQRIAEAMDFLADTGFNTVFPVVWNRGFTAYPSQIMREQFGVEIDSRYQYRDPLAELIIEANRVGLKVIPWFEYGFVCSYNLKGGHLLAKKPAWAARDRTVNLLKKNNFEWMNSLDPEVQDFLLGLMLEAAHARVVEVLLKIIQSMAFKETIALRFHGKVAMMPKQSKTIANSAGENRH